MKKQISIYEKKINGITLIALVITIIILLILAAVSLNMLIGDNGILTKAQTASEETNKSQATETINLKIINIQVTSYIEEGKLPSLQYLADKLCEDDDLEYVSLESKLISALAPIDTTGYESIFVKLNNYPYEFEINSSLHLASIDGEVVSNNDSSNNTSGGISTSELANLLNSGDFTTATFEAYADGDNTHSLSLSSGKYLIKLSGNTTFDVTSFFVDDNNIESIDENIYLCDITNSITINWYCNHYGVHKYLYVEYKSL